MFRASKKLVASKEGQRAYLQPHAATTYRVLSPS